jgi:hypothetical protein
VVNSVVKKRDPYRMTGDWGRQRREDLLDRKVAPHERQWIREVVRHALHEYGEVVGALP